jgi:CRISPR-associated protein Csx16
MTTIIVSRHESAIRWLKARYPDADVFPELPPVDSLSLGDLVVGNLPLFLVHELNQKGIEVGIISMKVPLELRGTPLG